MDKEMVEVLEEWEEDIRRDERIKAQSKWVGKLIEERDGDAELLTREEKKEVANKLLKEKGIINEVEQND